MILNRLNCILLDLSQLTLTRRALLKADLRSKSEQIPIDIILANILYITALTCYYFVFNGLVSDEKDLLQILKPNHQIYANRILT